MTTNTSPWLAQLKRTRLVQTLPHHTDTEILIIGGGIAGIATAFFTLKYTNHTVLLLEAYKVAHGATGHNAGQIASYFERQISDIAKEYGIEKAADAQSAIDSAWLLLQEMYDDAKLKIHFSSFTGYAGCQDLDQIMIHLENIEVCHKAHIRAEGLLIASNHPTINDIPDRYKFLYTTKPHSEILELLESKDQTYIAAVTGRKGCMNSAIFCEELVHFLLTKYKSRFTVAEHSHVDTITLEKNNTKVTVNDKTVTANRVILCTNGFEKFTIINNAGSEINNKFHQNVTGSVGYMAGYCEQKTKNPIAISYLPKLQSQESPAQSTPYIYLTRRDYEHDTKHQHSLICIGGPETLMDDTTNYHYSHSFPQEAQEQIDTFLQHTYKHAPQETKYAFKWHGLMGYTKTGLRMIGPEPLNHNLLYNLGCNGVGILSSIYGGRKIAQILNGDTLKQSVFDPK